MAESALKSASTIARLRTVLPTMMAVDLPKGRSMTRRTSRCSSTPMRMPTTMMVATLISVPACAASQSSAMVSMVDPSLASQAAQQAA